MQDNAATLRALADARGFRIGAAVGHEPLIRDPRYREILAREFNVLVCENAMKCGPTRPARDRFEFAEADAIVAFAEEHGMAVRGHALVWHNMLPSWLEKARLSYDDAIDVVRGHIFTVMSHFRGKVYAWDVVNEGVADDGRWRDSLFLRTFGPDYMAMAFHWAHEADPEAQLFYNDYSADAVNPKSTAIYGIVRGLLKEGVPVHGVGLQMHLSLYDTPKWRALADNIARFNDLGLDVQITEMDVRTREPASPDDLREQARAYRDVMEACLSATRCSAFLVWGVTDRYSWIPEVFKGEGSGLLFDASGQAKPAYFALREALG